MSQKGKWMNEWYWKRGWNKSKNDNSVAITLLSIAIYCSKIKVQCAMSCTHRSN